MYKCLLNNIIIFIINYLYSNTNAMIASHFAPNIPRENFTALTRLD